MRVRVDGAESDDDGDWVHRPLDVGRDDARAPSTDDGREYGVDGLGIVPARDARGNGAGDASEVEILHMTEARRTRRRDARETAKRTNARAEKETSRRWMRNQRWRWRGNG